MQNQNYQALLPYLRQIKKISRLISILNFDIETKAPPKGMEAENEAVSELVGKIAEIESDPRFIEKIEIAYADSSLNEAERSMVNRLHDNAIFARKVGVEKRIAWNKTISKCTEVWRQAKVNGDYDMVLPYFEKTIEAKIEEAEAKRKPHHKTRYDALLEDYEPGSSEGYLDKVFGELGEFLRKSLPLALEKQAQKPSLAIPFCRKHQQENLSLRLLKLEGFDLERGTIGESEHPFTDWLGENDYRVTTHYYEDDFRRSLYSVLHEGGHAIHGQQWGENHFANCLDAQATSAICETHSRFFENIIGRSAEFAPHLLGLCRYCFGEEFDHFDNESFLSSIRHVEPSLIRTEADEFTYCLHIIIRYEFERNLINGRVKVQDLNHLWNEKYMETLNVHVPSDRDGILQDTHWFSGLFGYFPSYALGNIYGAMLLRKMEREMPFWDCVKHGDLIPIIEWMREKEIAFDMLSPNDWIKKATGEKLSSAAYIEYLTQRYLK